MKLYIFIALLLIAPNFCFCQVECPDYGQKKPRSRLSNIKYLHYGVDISTLLYADKPWVFSTIPHIGVYAEINILRHFSVGATAGSHFKLELNTDLPVYYTAYNEQNLYFKFNCKVYLNKVFSGIWISPVIIVDNNLTNLKLLEIGFANRVSKIGIIDYHIGFTIHKPQFLNVGISLGVLKRRYSKILSIL